MNAITNIKQKGIQIGDVTHNQDQLATVPTIANLKVKNIKKIIPAIPIPLPVLFFISFSLYPRLFRLRLVQPFPYQPKGFHQHQQYHQRNTTHQIHANHLIVSYFCFLVNVKISKNIKLANTSILNLG